MNAIEWSALLVTAGMLPIHEAAARLGVKKETPKRTDEEKLEAKRLSHRRYNEKRRAK